MKKFLVLGHPRSGTGYMATLFQRFGYDVSHEKMGKDGISSWMFAVEENQVFMDRSLNRKNYQFEHTLMTMRHPNDIVSSIYYTGDMKGRSLHYRQAYLPLENYQGIEKAVQSVVGWYALIEQQDPALIMYVDRQPAQQLAHFLQMKEAKDYPLIPALNRKVNARKHADLSWEDIKHACHEQTWEAYRRFCNRQGYRAEEDAR